MAQWAIAIALAVGIVSAPVPASAAILTSTHCRSSAVSASGGDDRGSRAVAPPERVPRADVAISPLDGGRCPASHPIKAAVNLQTGQCVYHEPGGPHYERVRPDVCFATEDAARREDCWKAGEVL